MILLQVDLVSSNEFQTVYEGCYEIEDTFIFTWSSILSVGHYCWLCGPIRRLFFNSKADYLVRTIWRILNFLQSWLITHDSTYNCNSLLNLSIIWINVSFIMKFMLPLSPYHTIYLIIKLFRINFMFIRLEDCSIFIGPFIDTPLNCSINFKHLYYSLIQE